MTRKKTTGLVAALGLSLALGSTAAVLPTFVAAQAATPAQVSISGLEVNHLVEPDGVFGIDDPKPVFCWGFDSNVVGSKQESYRIEVSMTPAFNANKIVWDWGAVDSDETTDITYGSTGHGSGAQAGDRLLVARHRCRQPRRLDHLRSRASSPPV